MYNLILTVVLTCLLQAVGAGVITMREVNVCRDCRMAEEILTCGMEISQPVILKISCEVETLITTERLMVVAVEGRAAAMTLS